MGEEKPNRLVTANRIRDGVPVYFIAPGRWSTSIDAAVLVPETDGDGLLAVAQADVAPPPVVVGPYLIEAEAAEGHVQPLSLRERIRANGPTI
jgi:hypothetical protein